MGSQPASSCAFACASAKSPRGAAARRSREQASGLIVVEVGGGRRVWRRENHGQKKETGLRSCSSSPRSTRQDGKSEGREDPADSGRGRARVHDPPAQEAARRRLQEARAACGQDREGVRDQDDGHKGARDAPSGGARSRAGGTPRYHGAMRAPSSSTGGWLWRCWARMLGARAGATPCRSLWRAGGEARRTVYAPLEARGRAPAGQELGARVSPGSARRAWLH